MTRPHVLQGDRRGGWAPTPHRPDLAWRLLGWVGAAFVVVGAADLGLAWYPSVFGSADWEFGTITQTLNGLPVPVLGLAALMAAAAAAGRRRVVRALAVLCLVGVVVLLGLAVLYATNVPLGLRAVVDEVPRLGLKKAIARSVVQFALYSAVFVALAVVGWRGTAENVEGNAT